MPRFSGVRDASEFLVSLIAKQATQQGEPLSAVEREMLYFSETGWTLPGMPQTVATFERNCVEGDYEKKISKLVASLLKGLKKGSKEELAAWCEAVRVLRQEDRYLLVMIDEAGVKVRPPGDLCRLWGAGVAICAILIPVGFLLGDYTTKASWKSAAFWIWAAEFASACAYALFYLIAGKAKTLDLTGRVLSRFMDVFQKRK